MMEPSEYPSYDYHDVEVQMNKLIRGLDPNVTEPQKESVGTYIPSHLSSPITNDDPLFLLAHDRFFCKRHRAIKEILKEEEFLQGIYGSKCDPYVCLEQWIERETLEEGLNKIYEKTITSATESLFIHETHFTSSTENQDVILVSIKKKWASILSHLKTKEDVLMPHYRMMKRVEKIKDSICFKEIKYGNLIKHRDLRADREIFLLDCKKHGKVIGPTNLLLCTLDIAQSRFSLLLYWLVNDFLKKYPTSLYETGTQLIDQFTKLRFVMKDDVFTLIAQWESLLVGFTVNDDVNDIGFSELYDTTRVEMEKLLEKHHVGPQVLNDLLPPDRQADTIKKYLELTGIMKIFGHPCLDVKDSMDELKKHATERAGVNMDIVYSARGIFIRDFCKNYFLKKRRWPPVVQVPGNLAKYFKYNEYPPSGLWKDYNSWNLVKLGKVFDYDYSTDTSELLKDSAIAPKFEHWSSQYDNCAFIHLHGKRKPRFNRDEVITRVIDSFLKGNEHDVQKKIQEVDKGYMDPNDMMAVLCRKEQELKVLGRIFVKQTYQQRLAQTSMELNIAKHVMRYIPEQTMTEGELSQARRLTDIVKGQRSTIEILNLDLSKWNTKFRHALVYPFGEVVDQMFGFERLYRDNHLWFLQSHVFSNSRLHPPDFDTQGRPIPGDFYYNNHLGGLEGMRQKLWTMITVALIKLSAETMALNIDIICQGDNQVILLKYSPMQGLDRQAIRDRFLSELDNNFKAVNLKMKKSETWYSRSLCEYGKVRYYRGEAVSQGTKKICRLIPDINDGISSFMTPLSTINTITEGCAKMDFTPDSAFFVNQVNIVNYLARRKVLTYRMSQDRFTRYLYFPSDFGGISLSTYFSHYIRGFDDKVVLWASILKHLEKSCPSIFNEAMKLCQLYPNTGEPQVSRVMEDIFSLNVTSLPSIEMDFKNEVTEYIKSDYVTNPEIRKLYEDNQSVSQEDLVSRLATMTPMFLPVCHELLRHSNAGIMISLRNKLKSVATIQKMTQRTTGKNFLEVMQVNNSKVVKILRSYREKRIHAPSNRVHFSKYDCPTRLAKYLRETHWQTTFIGGSKSCPFHQVFIQRADSTSSIDFRNSILIQCSQEFARVNNSSYLHDGPYESYLGSATKEKVEKPSLEMYSKTSHMKSLQQLVLTRTWMMRLGANNLLKIIDDLIKEKMPIIPEELADQGFEDWCALNYGGNILHRFFSIIERNSAIINFLPTLGTHIKQSTNNLSSLTAGGRDFTVHFQMVMLTNMARLLKLKEHTGLTDLQYCATITCSDCTTEITKVEFDTRPERTPRPHSEPTMTPQRQDITVEHHHSPYELIRYVSVHLGKIVGQVADANFTTVYQSKKPLEIQRFNPLMSNVSINDFRNVNFRWFLVGVLQNCKTLRLVVMEHNRINLLFQKSTVFTHLGQVLINAKMVDKFLRFFSVRGYEHYHTLKPEKLSELIMKSFIDYIAENRKQIALDFLVSNFQEESHDAIYNRLTWVRRFIAKHKEFASTRTIPDVTHHHKLEFKIKQLFIVLNPTASYTRSIFPIKEEQVIPRLRGMMLKESTALMLRATEPIKITPTTCTKNPEVLRTLMVQFYIQMSELVPGDSHIKNLHHIIRLQGSVSTGGSKVREIVSLLGLDTVLSVDNVYCLAEGSGSILEYLGGVYPKARLIYNTLLEPSIDMRQGPDQNEAPVLTGSPTINPDNILRYNPLALGETNIMTGGFLEKILVQFKLYPPGIITIDAESPDGSDNIEILETYLNIATFVDAKVLIIKVFLRDGTYIKLMNILQLSSRENCIIKPLSSNCNNEEIYVVSLSRETTPMAVQDRARNLHMLLPYLVRVIGKNKMSSNKAITVFLETSSALISVLYPGVDFLSAYFPQNVYTSFLSSNKKQYCGVYCWAFQKDLLGLMRTVHKMDPGNLILLHSIRAVGVHSLLIRMATFIAAVTFKLVLKTNKSWIDACTSTTITSPSRSIILVSGRFGDAHDLFESGEDSKTLMRHLIVDTRCKHSQQYGKDTESRGAIEDFVTSLKSRTRFLSTRLLQS
ncbi:RNA-dependent RNA polymerase [Hymenopteran anphe-related virus OKIAV71]|uniref:RNA-directed RNA polymerase L n=1 Tax=Hymenopteran anphe-related virus OKIAV71 TaxID=2792596 RepID=A0AAE7P4P5_9MONO|nr:RNA-dependent RNA polymerase [Hymenopteran anphe-related virus OKIAV71]QPL15379.1 RNA-dependent RNA polymerase [Hymenopteran anphe-related virus OKIAV71]